MQKQYHITIIFLAHLFSGCTSNAPNEVETLCEILMRLLFNFHTILDQIKTSRPLQNIGLPSFPLHSFAFLILAYKDNWYLYLTRYLTNITSQIFPSWKFAPMVLLLRILHACWTVPLLSLESIVARGSRYLQLFCCSELKGIISQTIDQYQERSPWNYSGTLLLSPLIFFNDGSSRNRNSSRDMRYVNAICWQPFSFS